MNFHRSPSEILIFFLFLFLTIPIVGADKNSEVIQALMGHGSLRYEQGDVLEATADYCRVLLFDPSNEMARKFLIMVASKQGLTAQEKANLFLLEDLYVTIDNLKEKIAYYHHKKNYLIQNLLNKGYSETPLNQELLSIETQSEQPKHLKALRRNLTQEALRKENRADSPEAVIELLYFDKEELVREILSVQRQYDYLRELNKKDQFFVRQKMAVPKEVLIKSEEIDQSNRQGRSGVVSFSASAASSSEGKVLAQDTVEQDSTSEQKNEVALLKSEFALLRKQLDELQDMVQQKDKKLEHLTEQLIDYALQLKEKEGIVVEKDENLYQLNERFFDFESRFELGQKIIQKKDTELQSLQDALSHSQSQLAHWNEEGQSLLSSKDEKLIELNGILQIYKGMLKDATKKIKENSVDMSTFQDQLNFFQKQLLEKDQALQKTKQDFTVLENQLAEVQEELRILKEGYPQNKSPNLKLKDDIQDLRSQLKDIQHFLSKQLIDFEDMDAPLAIFNF